MEDFFFTACLVLWIAALFVGVMVGGEDGMAYGLPLFFLGFMSFLFGATAK